jgi:hypothetical protein
MVVPCTETSALATGLFVIAYHFAKNALGWPDCL